MRFSDAQIELFSRQIILREVGGDGQAKLLAARGIALGGGAAFDAALSYLAGAGLGAIDVLTTSASAAAAELPFATLATRSPDARIGELTSGPGVTLDDYDVALSFDSRAHRVTPEMLPPGRPARGSVAVVVHPKGVIEMLALPRAAACLACVVPDVTSRDAADAVAGPDAARLAVAGALAALACCRWIFELDRPADPRVLRLASGSALWVESPLARRAVCPRGCPPPTQSV